MTLGTHPAASKVRQKPWNHKRQEGWHKHPRAELGRTTFWSPKSQCVYGPENEIAAVTFFAKNGAALTKSNTLASVTEWQDSGEHGCWLKVSSPACMLPIFAKAPCCLELFGWLFLSWTYTHTSIFWLHKTMFWYGHVWIERLTLKWRPLGSCQTSLVVFHLAPVSIIFLHNIALKGKILLLKMMFVSFCCFTRNSGARGTWNKGVFVGGKT